MFAFVTKRFLYTGFVLFAVSLVVFIIFFKTPGIDPARQFAGRNPTPQVIAQIRHQFGLDRPLPVQYLIMMKNLFITRNLVSYSNQGLKVVPEFMAALPVTLSVVLGATVIWLVMSVAIGVASAVLKNTVWDLSLMILSLIGISLPVFWLGEVVNIITQGSLHNTFLFSWVPPPGYTSLTANPLKWFEGLVFPWLTLSVQYIGLYARVLRSNLIEVQGADYIRTARAKGMLERRVLFRHALRNSLLAFVSLFGLDFGVLVGGGAILTEVVFGLPGVGLLTYQSLTNFDLPVIMVTVVYGAFFIVVANALVDVAYAWLDPRIRLV
jgi:peptide/nickel transport system permease protein